jgi:hypothetical protein
MPLSKHGFFIFLLFVQEQIIDPLEVVVVTKKQLLKGKDATPRLDTYTRYVTCD